MSTQEGQQSQVSDDPGDDFWDQLVSGIDENQLHSTLPVLLNVPLSTKASIPLNIPCSSLPTPSSHKVDLTEAQVRVDGYGKDVMVNDEDGESDDEFEGKSSGSDGLESTDSDGSVIDEDQIFESDPEDDDKWERVYDGRFW